MFFKKKQPKEPEYMNISFVYSQVSRLIDEAARAQGVKEKDLPHLRMAPVHGESRTADCPFCGRKMKMNLKVTNNVFRCPACGEEGNSRTLYASKMGVSTKEAGIQLKQIYEGFTPEAIAKLDIPTNVEENTAEAAPIGLRDFTYRELLKASSLSNKHRNNLKKRGLTDEEIEKTLFKTLPTIGVHTIACKCLGDSGVQTELSKYKWSIPGFYFDPKFDGWMFIRRKSPMLVPVVNHNGQISQFEMRNNDLPKDATEAQKEKFKRYTKFSSAEEQNGVSVSGLENIHYAGFDFESETTPKTVTLTEGALKATVASILSGGKPFVALLGVNAQGHLQEEMEWLKAHGTETIILAFDMDYIDNDNVKDALQKAIKTIKDAGLVPKQITWDKRYKGIDDYLASLRRAKLEG